MNTKICHIYIFINTFINIHVPLYIEIRKNSLFYKQFHPRYDFLRISGLLPNGFGEFLFLNYLMLMYYAS